MKSIRILSTTLYAVALVALLGGCGTTSSPTNVEVQDEAPPTAPKGLHVVINETTGLSLLAWDANSEPNIGGYTIYAYSPDPQRDDSYLQIGDVDAAATTYHIPGGFQTGHQYFRVQARNNGGNHSPFSATLQVLLPGPTGGTGGSPGGRPGSGVD